MKHAFIIWRRQDGRNIGEHQAHSFPFYGETKKSNNNTIGAAPMSWAYFIYMASSPILQTLKHHDDEEYNERTKKKPTAKRKHVIK